MKRISIVPLLFVILLALSNPSKAQIAELKEFQQKKTKTFISNGEGRSKGLKFSMQYPASYEISDVNGPDIVKGFSNNVTGEHYIILILKHDKELSLEGKKHVLSQENLEKVVRTVSSSSSEFLSYKNDFSIFGFPSAYIEFKVPFDEFNLFHRNYSIEVNNYSVIISFVVPLQKKLTSIEARGIFKTYNSFFTLAVNTFKPINVKKDNKDVDFNLQEYLKYKDKVPETDKSKSNESWVNELYRHALGGQQRLSPPTPGRVSSRPPRWTSGPAAQSFSQRRCRTQDLTQLKPRPAGCRTSIRELSADREQLLTRIASLERNLEDVTGSIKRQAALAAAPVAAPSLPSASACD